MGRHRHYAYQTGSVLQQGNVICLGGDSHRDPRDIDPACNTAGFDTTLSTHLDRNGRTLPMDFGHLRLAGNQYSERHVGEERHE
jgi:hypothetical protein